MYRNRRLRSIISSILLLATLTQAVSAPYALASQQGTQLALEIMRTGEKKLGDFFPEALREETPPAGNPVAAQELDAKSRASFDREYDAYIGKLGKLGAIDAEQYRAWWKLNHGRFLTRLQVRSWKNMNLEELATSTWLVMLAERARAEPDPHWLTKQVEKGFSQPLVRATLTHGTKIVVTTLGVAFGILSAVLLYGPVNQVVSGYFESPVRPIREAAIVKGSKHLEWLTRITTWAFSKPAQLKKAADGAKEALEEAKSLARALDFPGMTPEEASAAWRAANKRWQEANQNWIEELPAYLRDARFNSYQFDFREPFNLYGMGASIADTNASAKMRDLEAYTDLLLKQEKVPAPEIKELLRRNQALFDARNAFKDPTELAQLDGALQAAREAMERSYRIEPVLLKRVLDSHLGLMTTQDQLASTLATALILEFQYPEFYRAHVDAPGARQAFEIMRASYGRDYYYSKVLPRLERLLDRLHLQIDLELRSALRIRKVVSAVTPNPSVPPAFDESCVPINLLRAAKEPPPGL